MQLAERTIGNRAQRITHLLTPLNFRDGQLLLKVAKSNCEVRYLMLPIRAFSSAMRPANPHSARFIAWLCSVRSRQ